MRSLLIGLAAVLFGCSASFAQSTPLAPNAPAMGATSPLGIPGAASPVGPVGIPLGATSLAPGGLSPAPFDPTAGANPCVGAAAATASASGMTTSTFDAAGVGASTMGLGAAPYGLSSGPMGCRGRAVLERRPEQCPPRHRRLPSPAGLQAPCRAAFPSAPRNSTAPGSARWSRRRFSQTPWGLEPRLLRCLRAPVR